MPNIRTTKNIYAAEKKLTLCSRINVYISLIVRYVILLITGRGYTHSIYIHRDKNRNSISFVTFMLVINMQMTAVLSDIIM